MPDQPDTAPAHHTRAATFRPSTYDAADNSLEVCWSVGAAGLRFDWYDGGHYTESLSMDPAHVRLDRLNAAGCLIDSHRTGSVSSVLGSVVPGSARIEAGQGIARVRLAKTPDVANTNAKIIDGHIRSLSVSYNVFKYERTEREGEHPLMHAIDWEPLEISMVVVPFDAAATVRAEGSNMPDIIDTQERGGDGPQPTRRDRRAVTVETIRERCGRSDDLSRAFERSLIEEHREEAFSMRELEDRIAAELVANRSLPSIDTRQGHRDGRVGEERHRQRDAFAEVLHSRITGADLPDTAREYAGAGMIDMARALLEANGERVRWARPAAIVDALARSGQHVASDFAYILNSAGSRYLINAYTASASPLRRLARKRDFPDFRTRFGLQAEGPAVLRNVPENAEFKRVTINDAANGAKLTTYGEILSISRQALINDDLGVFLQMALFWARAAAGTEGSYLAALIDGMGIVMGEDGKTLYHADHNNIMPAEPLSINSIGAARERMRTMKNRDGSTPADIVPKFLVVGPRNETNAEALLTAISATKVSDANPFAGKLELVVDSRLIGNSWRLFADPALNPVIEYGNLEGQGGLFTDTRIGFDVDGVDFKARTDIGAGAVDWRGTVMNPGA